MNDALRAAVWWISDYAYALVWQTRALFNRTAPSSFLIGSGVPIVVLPGVFETWKFMQPLVEEMHARGHPVHIVELLQRNHRPIAEMAEEVASYLQAENLKDVVLVAHSKGGLAGKLVMVGAAGNRVRGMVAIATPFGGSRYARLMLGRTLRAFSPADPAIVSLTRSTDINNRIISIYARFDPHIPEGSELPGAKNVLLDTGGHFRVLAHPRVLAEITVICKQHLGDHDDQLSMGDAKLPLAVTLVPPNRGEAMSELNMSADGSGDQNPEEGDRNVDDGMTDEQKRHDQLTSAPDASEDDAAPRIEVTEHNGIMRVDLAKDAPVRPGPGPGMHEADAPPPEE